MPFRRVITGSLEYDQPLDQEPYPLARLEKDHNIARMGSDSEPGASVVGGARVILSYQVVAHRRVFSIERKGFTNSGRKVEDEQADDQHGANNWPLPQTGVSSTGFDSGAGLNLGRSWVQRFFLVILSLLSRLLRG